MREAGLELEVVMEREDRGQRMIIECCVVWQIREAGLELEVVVEREDRGQRMIKECCVVW